MPNYIPNNKLIPAIETRYAGRHFRSRIEARWAVFFDVSGIKWDYEPEKFAMPEGEVYIPDFWLPECGNQDSKTLRRDGAFFEVKGAAPDEDAIRKGYFLSKQTDKHTYVFWGSAFDSGYFLDSWYETRRYFSKLEPSISCFRQCPYCGVVEIVPFSGHLCIASQAIAKQYNVLSWFDQHLKFPVSPMLELSREAAKSARFESPQWTEELKGLVLSAQRLREQKIFCSPSTYASIIAEATSWAAGGGGPYDESWYVRHSENLLRKDSVCDCYSCVFDRERITA